MISINRKAVRAAGGTQSDELAAKIKSVTSATTVGAVFVYDTRNDSDGGAWRKKCAGLSWYDETLNTATRGGRREFPSVAVIVVDNETSGSVYGTVTIYDGDDPSLPMWRVYNNVANNTMNGIYALNGRVYVSAASGSSGGGLYHLDFVNDFSARQTDASTNTAWGHQSPMTATGYVNTPNFWGGALVNISVNDVAATIVEGAEIGALGLPIPTVAVATDGGVSVIHPNGSVYDQTHTVYGDNQADHVTFDEKGGLSWASRNKSIYHLYLRNPLFADSSAAPDNIYYTTNNITAGKAVHPLGGGGTSITARANIGGRDFATGAANGLSIIKHNDGNPDEGMVSYHTSDYCTGYQLGDIRFAGLANVLLNDRSVKANTLTQSGSITSAVVATNAELKAYSGWSASNYVSRANDADFDFGTGDFSIMFWVKDSNAGESQNLISRSDASAEAGDWLIQSRSDASIDFYRHSGSDWVLKKDTSTGQIVANQWTQVCFVKRSSNVMFYINGKLDSSAANSDSFTPSGGSALTIGHSLGNNNPADNSSLSLVRISATAPTPQQVKEIYEAEKPLFRAGAKCLLQGGLDVVTALGYDDSTDLLHVATTAGADAKGVTVFKGLEAVDSFAGTDIVGAYDNPDNLTGWTANSIRKLGVGGGVSAYGRTDGSVGGVIVDLPPFDVRGDTNIADTKLPDDGKIRFTGVTTDATVTTIGQIPIAENEWYSVKARVTSIRVNSTTSSAYHTTTIEETFYRGTGGNVLSRGQIRKLSDETLASIDVDLAVDSGPQTIQVKVTGTTAVDRMQWNAEVEVQRISEKQYER